MNEQKICIKQYEQAADEKVSLGGIRWERKWDVCVQCDSREEAERVRAALTMKHEPTTGNVLMDAYHAMQAKKEAAQPEQSPLDRMAENARELGLDYEPVQEPVAWLSDDGNVLFGPGPKDKYKRPLYTTPPRREWQGLTEEERRGIREWQRIQEELGPVWAPMMLYLYEAIEAKLRERNA